MHSLVYNCPIKMRLEWILVNIYACFAWLYKLYSRIWDWCIYAIVDELRIFTLIDFFDSSLVWTIVVRAYI